MSSLHLSYHGCGIGEVTKMVMGNGEVLRQHRLLSCQTFNINVLVRGRSVYLRIVPAI
jgi:hypothetical protein